MLQATLDQVKELAGQKPEDSPLALPLKKFPASIPAAEQERIRSETLDAICKGSAAGVSALRALH